MVRLAAALLVAIAAGAFAADAPESPKGPVLFGDGAGRLWKWESGEKTFLTPEGQNLVLGGVGEKQLWGWSLEGDRARFFTLELPKSPSAKDAKDPKDQKARKEPPPTLVFDTATYPVPDRADRVGDRLLLVYGPLSDHPRYEIWKGGEKLAARAWDDGRTVFALSLGPSEGWILAGRDRAGVPWLEVSGTTVEVPEGWRGRLTVAVWAADEKLPPVPLAAGWGAPAGEPARPLLWGPDGWTQPSPDPESAPNAGIYPVLGAAAKGGTLSLAGWLAEEGGVLRVWFWDGKAATVPGGAADGQPQAFGAGKGGAYLVVRHQSAPWFTTEDGIESVPLAGLDADDRVVAVEPEAATP